MRQARRGTSSVKVRRECAQEAGKAERCHEECRCSAVSKEVQCRGEKEERKRCRRVCYERREVAGRGGVEEKGAKKRQAGAVAVAGEAKAGKEVQWREVVCGMLSEEIAAVWCE